MRLGVDATRRQHNDRVTQSGPFAVDASFTFVIVRDLGTIDSLAKHTLQDVIKRVTRDFQ